MAVVLLPIAIVLLQMIWFRQGHPWPRAMLLSGACFGAAVAMSSQRLSTWHALGFGPLLIFWVLVCIGLAVLVARFRPATATTPARTSRDVIVRSAQFGAAILIILVGITAVIAPPNTWDVLTYHMGRVMHWVQNGSVLHYQTDMVRQICFPPGAEYLLAHLYILTGSDRLTNTPQWLAYVGCILAVTRIARQLGADLRGQTLAAVFCATIPMAILQASSAKNDLVTAFWLLALTSFVLELLEPSPEHPWLYSAMAGLCLGLALLTKASAYLFAPPLLAWLVVGLFRRLKWQALKPLGLIAVIALILNAQHLFQNQLVFGTLFGPPSWTEHHRNESFGLGVIASNMLRNLSFHLALPDQNWNDAVTSIITTAHGAAGLSVNDPATTRATWALGRFGIISGWNDEGLAGSGLHLLAGLATIGFLVSKRSSTSRQRVYGLILLVGYILFSTYLRWNPWNCRLQLPLWILAAPILGAVLRPRMPAALMGGVMMLLLASAFPVALFNNARPIFGRETIFNTPRQQQIFKSRPELYDPYVEAIDLLEERGCFSIGLIGHEDAWEYPFWALMKDRIAGRVRMEYGRPAKPDFEDYRYRSWLSPDPCAVVVLSPESIRAVQTPIGRVYEPVARWRDLSVFMEARRSYPGR